MGIGMIMVDICNDGDAAVLEKHVASSKAYWTSKGYKLISDDQGSDVWSVYQSTLTDGVYSPGNSFPVPAGAVILIYEAVIG